MGASLRERFNQFQRASVQRLAAPYVIESGSLVYWRARILFSVLGTALVFGFFATFSGVFLAVKENAWGLVVFDLFVYLLCYSLIVTRRLRFETKALITSFGFYVIGVMVILSVGPLSGGAAWLFAFAVLVGLLLGFKAAVFAIGLNAISLSLIAWLMMTNAVQVDFVFFRSLQSMVATGVNFLVLNAIVSVSVAALVQGLVDTSERKGALAQNLERERGQLIKAKTKLEMEISERKAAETEREKLQQQLQTAKKLESLGTLAGGVAHDLNNILSGVVSYPDLLLLDLEEDSPLRGPLLSIKQSGEKAANIVQDLLTLARRGVASRKVIDVNQVIDDFLASPEWKKMVEQHENVRLQTNLDSELLHVVGSGVHISKSLMNLVANALDAMPAGGTIRVTTQSRYLDTSYNGYELIPEGDYTTLAVADVGIGISAHDLERIFEPFYTKKTMGRSGTGLGMSVVWGTVKDHDGYIDVETQEGNGTTFTLYFPATRARAEYATTVCIEDYLGNKETVLIVDDSPEQRKLAEKMMQRLGYDVSTAASGEEAICMVKHKSYDMLILDMIMPPGINGLETYRQILTFAPYQKSIIASGYAMNEHVREAQQMGAGSYIKKPFTLEKIGLAVRDGLDQAALSVPSHQ